MKTSTVPKAIIILASSDKLRTTAVTLMTTPTTNCFKIKKRWTNQCKTQEALVATAQLEQTLIAPTKKCKIRRCPSGSSPKKPSAALQKKIDQRNACLQLHRACASSDIATFGSYVDPDCNRNVIVTEPFLDYWLEKKCLCPVQIICNS